MRWSFLALFLVGGSLRALSAPPVNDAFAGAIPLPESAVRSAEVASASVLDTRYQTPNLAIATAEANEPPIDGVSGAHSLWYLWTAPRTCHGVFTMSVNLPVGTGMDATAHLAVYTGDQLDRLRLESRPVSPPAYFNTNGFRLGEFLAREGTVYRFRVDATGRNATNVNCFVGLTLAATNDSFASRKVFAIGGSSILVPYSTAAVSIEDGEPSSGSPGSLWFEFSVPEAGVYAVSDVYPGRSGIDRITLFQGDRLDHLQSIGWRVAQVDSTVFFGPPTNFVGRTNLFTRFYANSGERYIVRVSDDTILGGYDAFTVVRSPRYDLVPAPRVRLGQLRVGPPRVPTPTMRSALLVEGQPNRLYDIQTSSDLREWRHWQWHVPAETNSAVDLENGPPPDPFIRVVAPD